MGLHHGVSTLIAVVSLAGISTPAAYALDSETPVTGGHAPAAQIEQHPTSSTDGLLIGVGTAGAIALAGVGVGSARRGHGTTASRTKHLGAARGS